jgi:heme exporter protein D
MGKLGLFVWLCLAWCAVTLTWLAIERKRVTRWCCRCSVTCLHGERK